MTIAEADLKVGDRVVYPNQGVCRVVGTTEMDIAGRRESFIRLSREDDQAIVMVPRGRLEKVGLRRVADPGELKRILDYLAAPVEGPELDWKVRHRTHGERMSEGGLLGLAQVVKGLTTLSDLRPLPPKERELYDNARHLLVMEVAAAAGLSEVSAEDAVDVALFPPGVERKKPSLAIPLPSEDGEELGFDEDLRAGIDEIGPVPPEAEAEEGEEEEGEEAEAEASEEAEEEEAPKPAKRGRKPKAAAAEPAAEEAPAEAEEAKPARARKARAPAAKKTPAKKTATRAAKEPKPKAEKPKAKTAAKPKAKKS